MEHSKKIMNLWGWGSGDLDECNGKFVDGQYKYFATDSFPFFPRCHWGEISRDFIQKRK